MTTLATEIELTDAELHDLLAHRWTAALSGQNVDETAELLIPTPPMTITLHWYFDNIATVNGLVIRCDTEIRKWFDLKPPISFRADDQIEIHLTLNRGDVT
jgi:hypothetical protein